MFDEVKEKNRAKNRILKKREKSLDSYLLGNKFSWKKDDKPNDDENDKYEFLKKNFKISSIIPEKTEKYYETPDNLGYFNTRFGTIAVGNNKLKKGTVVFSFVPEDEKDKQNIVNREIDSPNYYFGDDKKIRKERFLAGEVSFKYDPERSEIQKLKDDNDGIVDDEKELLYTDDGEDYLIDELKKQDNRLNKDSGKIEERLEKIREIKKEKEEDNEKFLDILKDFVDKLEKDKLKKRVESEDAIMRRKRILEFSLEHDLQALSLMELRKRLEELLQKDEFLKGMPEKYKSLKLENWNKQEVIEALKELLISSPEEKIPEFA